MKKRKVFKERFKRTDAGRPNDGHKDGAGSRLLHQKCLRELTEAEQMTDRKIMELVPDMWTQFLRYIIIDIIYYYRYILVH